MRDYLLSKILNYAGIDEINAEAFFSKLYSLLIPKLKEKGESFKGIFTIPYLGKIELGEGADKNILLFSTKNVVDDKEEKVFIPVYNKINSQLFSKSKLDLSVNKNVIPLRPSEISNIAVTEIEETQDEIEKSVERFISLGEFNWEEKIIKPTTPTNEVIQFDFEEEEKSDIDTSFNEEDTLTENEKSFDWGFGEEETAVTEENKEVHSQQEEIEELPAMWDFGGRDENKSETEETTTHIGLSEDFLTKDILSYDDEEEKTKEFQITLTEFDFDKKIEEEQPADEDLTDKSLEIGSEQSWEASAKFKNLDEAIGESEEPEEIKPKLKERAAQAEEKKSSKIMGYVWKLVSLILLFVMAVFIYSKLYGTPEWVNEILYTKEEEAAKIIPKIIHRDYKLPVTYPYNAKESIIENKPIVILSTSGDVTQNKPVEQKIEPLPDDKKKEDGTTKPECQSDTKKTGQQVLNETKKETKPEEKTTKPDVKEKINVVKETNTGTDLITKQGEIFIVQVSSWRQKSIAESEVLKYVNKGYQAFIAEVNIPGRGGTWYRVKVGNFNTLDEAKKFLKTVQ